MTLEHGLSSDAVEKHRVRYGKNELPTDPGVCVWWMAVLMCF